MTEPGGARTCIMVADGDVVVRHALAAYLRGCGYRVVEAGNCADAATMLDDHAVAVELVLCDARLDGNGGGFGLKRDGHQRWPGVEIVLAGSVATAAEEAAEICEKGPDLARPYDPQLVTDHIAQWRARRERH